MTSEQVPPEMDGAADPPRDAWLGTQLRALEAAPGADTVQRLRLRLRVPIADAMASRRASAFARRERRIYRTAIGVGLAAASVAVMMIRGTPAARATDPDEVRLAAAIGVASPGQASLLFAQQSGSSAALLQLFRGAPQ